MHVAVGVIVRDDGAILLSRRAAGVHQGGKWEFPGGKLEAGESVIEALRRELDEELGIRLLDARPLIRIPWSYPDLDVLLDVWRVERFAGEPVGREGQPLEWFEPQALGRLDFPAANRPIVAAAQLPGIIAITPPDAQHEPDLARRLTGLAAKGYRIHLRLPQLDAGAYTALLERVGASAPEVLASLVLTSSVDEVLRFGAAGLHLCSARLSEVGHAAASTRVSVSCHSPDELRRAAAAGAHYAYLSPVRATRTHPEATPLGWQRFAAWVDAVPLPVYALGGMERSMLETAWSRGAQGIAAIRSIWDEA